MKAAVQHNYGPPADVFAVEDVATPTIKDDEVLVQMRAAGVNWADNSAATGKPYVMRLGYGLRRPRQGVRGTDIAGVVEAVGSGVEEFHVGDEVLGWCSAAFASLAAVPADHLVEKPASLSFEEAATLPMAGCVALQALRDVAGVEAGDKVLINGASGGIGSFAVQIAKAMGAEVTGVCSTRNVELLKALGVDHVIDYVETDFTEGAERYNVILDMADNRSIAQRRRVLEPGGTLIPNSGVGGPWFGSIGRILRARLMSPFVSHRLMPFLSISKRDDLAELVRLVDLGVIQPVVGKSYAMVDAGAAIEEAGSGHARGKVVVTP